MLLDALAMITVRLALVSEISIMNFILDARDWYLIVYTMRIIYI